MHKTLYISGGSALKTFHFFEGGACVHRRGEGACAMAQWHSGQSKNLMILRIRPYNTYRFTTAIARVKLRDVHAGQFRIVNELVDVQCG